MTDTELREQIYQAALPLLKGRKLTDLVVGISLLAVELDGNDLAVSYVLRDDLKGGCSIFPYMQSAVGKSAEEIGRWFVDGRDDLQRSVGAAVLTAASHALELTDTDSPEKPFGIELHPGDTVGMIGMIPPVAMRLKKLGCKLMIFDKGQCPAGNSDRDLYPMEQQEALLPRCDVLFLSGTTTVNGTAASLLELAKPRAAVLIGSSVPMIPKGYAGTPVRVLAGSWWRHEDKAEIFRLISQAAGMMVLGKYMVKKNVVLAE